LRSQRFLDLYITESREHHRLLVRSLLRLEAGEAAAVEEAFRAAHTIKGLAAAMGHNDAAAAAHTLEDRLGEVRARGAAIDAETADELLAAADRLEASVAKSLAQDATGSENAARLNEKPDRPNGGARPAKPSAGLAAAVAAGAKRALVVRLAPDAPLPEARAALIQRAVEALGGVVAVEPVDETGTFWLYLADDADADRIEAAVRRAGDIAAVHIEDIGERRVASADTQPEALPASVRVDRGRLDELAEGIAELSVLHARAGEAPDALRSDRAGAVLSALQRTVLELRMVPVSIAFERLARVVRDAARLLDKEVDFDLTGGEIELDQAVLDALVDPLVHLLRNAVDHALELPAERVAAGKPRKGTVRTEVLRERNSVRIVVRDDGRGVNRQAVAERARSLGLLSADREPSDDDVFRFLIQPGFSTAPTVTELSGRGVGLDVVAARMRTLGGAIEMNTTDGAGTTFTLRVPLTLALAHALRICVGGEDYAMPLTNISEVVTLEGDSIAPGRRGAVHVRGDLVPLVDLGSVLGSPAGRPAAAVVAELGGRRVALAVDRIVGHEQIVVKSFDAPAGTLPVFSGATLLPDGRPALLIDPLSVL
jgi:two-component system chemotaxis sensor kinase CheA